MYTRMRSLEPRKVGSELPNHPCRILPDQTTPGSSL